jgi:hypothetical protein
MWLKRMRFFFYIGALIVIASETLLFAGVTKESTK